MIKNQIKLNDYKKIKQSVKVNTIKKCLTTKPFILFYQYNSFNSIQRAELTKTIKLNGFNSLIIKNSEVKNVLKGEKFNKLRNMLSGNIILVFTEDTKFIKSSVLKNFSTNFKLMLIGGIYNNKVYRPSEINKLAKLDENVKKQAVMVLNNPLNSLKNVLANLKK